MKLGVNILDFGPAGSPDSLLGWARFAEQAGFSIAMMSDRGPLTPDVQALYPAPFYDPFVTLAWLAGQTEQIELGTTVALLPYRHPLLTARMAANIDRFSGGRFVFGVGVGWSEPEFASLGVPFG
jgi:alkanesulfonate monooxygenase SsuD/methylene tetrahydromethanopterin reductase-like flavin-dependent oxidoreductase (luciferase family)